MRIFRVSFRLLSLSFFSLEQRNTFREFRSCLLWAPQLNFTYPSTQHGHLKNLGSIFGSISWASFWPLSSAGARPHCRCWRRPLSHHLFGVSSFSRFCGYGCCFCCCCCCCCWRSSDSRRRPRYVDAGRRNRWTGDRSRLPLFFSSYLAAISRQSKPSRNPQAKNKKKPAPYNPKVKTQENLGYSYKQFKANQTKKTANLGHNVSNPVVSSFCYPSAI